MAKRGVEIIDVIKCFNNLSAFCYSVVEICNFILENCNPPPQLRHDIQCCIIPQTKSFKYIADRLIGTPDEKNAMEVMSLMDSLREQYSRVFLENKDFFLEKIKNKEEIQKLLKFITECDRLSIQFEPQDSEETPLDADVAQPVQLLPLNQETRANLPHDQDLEPPQPINLEDLTSNNNEGAWEKLCEAISSLLKWLKIVYEAIKRNKTLPSCV